MDLANYRQNKPIKALVIGDSGSGKTGALASSANAGYKLRVLDYDNGMESLAMYTKPEAKANVKFETLTDAFKLVGGVIVPVGQPTAFSRGLSLLDKWKTPSDDLGPVASWGQEEILVIDSLTFMSRAAMQRVLSLVGRSGEQPQIQDWGRAMDDIESTLGLLYSDTIKCNVLILSHITYIGDETALVKGYPNTLGNKLPPKVGRYFNYILHVKSKGQGANARRVILTQPESNIDVKCCIPGLARELPLESGLADFFAAASGAKPQKDKP